MINTLEEAERRMGAMKVEMDRQREQDRAQLAEMKRILDEMQRAAKERDKPRVTGKQAPRTAPVPRFAGDGDYRQGGKIIVAKDADGGGWKQQVVDGDEIVEFVDGLEDDTAPVELGDAYAMMLIRDADGARQRYVRLAGSDISVFPAILGDPVATDSSGYEFAEATETSDGTFAALVGGRTDEGHDFPAWEPNEFKGLANGTKVYIKRSVDPDTGDPAYGIIRECLANAGDITLEGATGTADTDTWDYKTADGATISLVTRLYYDAAAKELCQFARTFTLDANGNVTAISVETKSTIFTAGTNCAGGE